MGCAESEDIGATYEERAATLGSNFTKAEFQKVRGASTVDSVLSQFKKIGKCLNGCNESAVPVKELKKVCFLMCNTYTKAEYQLGVGPLNDAFTVASNHANMGYSIYFLHNSKKEDFLKFLPIFLKNTKTALTVFYTGHGASVPDKSGDESDGFDEAMVFDVGYILDDDLAVQLKNNCSGNCRVVLLTDCCHSGSIWDIQSAKRTKTKMPPNIISLSAAKDSQTAKQTTIGKKSQGIFTFYFWKFINENSKITPKQMEPKINTAIKKFNQCFTIACTSNDLMNKQIFL